MLQYGDFELRAATAGGTTCWTWQVSAPDALPAATLPRGHVAPPGIEPETFHLAGECVNHYTLEP